MVISGAGHSSSQASAPLDDLLSTSEDKSHSDRSSTGHALSSSCLSSLSLHSSGLDVTVHEQHSGVLLGSIVWPGGRYLGQYLQQRHPPHSLLLPTPQLCPFFSLPADFLRGARVVELGSGTGVTGIVAARHSPSLLVLSDIDALLPLLTSNVRTNLPGHWLGPHTLLHGSTTVHCVPLLWSTALTAEALPAPLRESFDWLLLSDVVYAAHSTTHAMPDNHSALFHVMRLLACASPSMRALLSYTRRMEEEMDFFDRVRQAGWCWVKHRADEVLGVKGDDERVELYLLWRNPSVTPAMHAHVRDVRLSDWCTQEKARQEAQLQAKLERRRSNAAGKKARQNAVVLA